MQSEDLSYDIFSILERARKRNKEGNRIINGCAGMLYTDDKQLCTHKEVINTIRTDFTSYLGYPSVIGSKEYKDGVLKWIFEDKKSEIEKRYSIPFCATLGGTGALEIISQVYSELGGVGVVGNLSWPNYPRVFAQARLPMEEFELFNKELKFNFEGLKKALDNNVNKGKRVLLIINDPCHNPSGYCLNKDEYDRLFDLISSYDSKVSLFMDIAYFDYSPVPFFFKDKLLEKKWNFPIYVAFSCSKSFSLYGLRLGAGFGLLSSKEESEAIENKFRLIACSTYSCPNNGAMGPMANFFNNPKALKEVKDEIHSDAKRLNNLGKRLLKVLDSLGFKYYPYECGFYITFIKENALEFCKELEKKDIFFAPIGKNLVRVAVCGMNLEDIDEFEKRIKTIV